MPTTVATATDYTYTVADGDTNTAADDTASLTFSITVEAVPDTAPSFGTATIASQTFTQGTAVDLTLPAATGGNAPLTYALTPAIPGLTFDPATRVLSGMPTTVATATDYTYTVADGDMNTAADDTATLMLSITVECGHRPGVHQRGGILLTH